MKKLSLLLFIVMLVAGWSRLGMGERTRPPHTDIELLQTALSAAGAESQGGELHAWAQISQGYYSLLQTEGAVATISEALGLNRHEYEINTRSTGQFTCASMECNLPDGALLRLTVSSLANTTAEVSIFLSNENMESYFSRLKAAFAAAGAEGKDLKITSCLEGSVDARLRDSEKMNIAYTVFQATDAVYRGAIETHGISQWSGWSPLFASSADTGEKQVNVCISLRWDADSAKTIIRVATPVLPSSY